MSRLSLLLLTITALTAFYADGAQQPGELVRTDGTRTPATLVSVQPDLTITVKTETGNLTAPADQFVRWGLPAEPRRGPQVLLSDGSLLLGDVVAIDGERLLLAADLWAEISLPMELVRGIIFWPPPDELKRDRLLDRLADNARQSDQVLLENGDLLDGRFTGLKDDTVGIQLASGQSQIPLQRVTALLLDPSLVAAPTTADRYLRVGFRDGTLLRTSRITAGQGRVSLTLAGGVKLSSAADWDTSAELVFIASRGPHVTYVSDLKPLGYKYIPFLDLAWDYYEDRNAVGGRLRAHGHLYEKGLGMHSTSRLAYALDRPYRLFAAELAVDDSARGGGSVVFRVLRDQADGAWQEAYRSPVVRGGTPPVAIQADVAGAKRLVLIVEFADRGDQRDHADWLDARLMP
jgi:hypothetical protein